MDAITSRIFGLAEVGGRVVLIYVLLLVLLRLGGRRELAQLGPMDLITMLLLSETVSPALTGGDDSLLTGAFAASVLIGLTILVGWLTFRSRRLERLVEGEARVLIRDGVVVEETIRSQRITNENLRTALHEQGLRSIDQVKRAFVEPDGSFSFIKRSDDE